MADAQFQCPECHRTSDYYTTPKTLDPRMLPKCRTICQDCADRIAESMPAPSGRPAPFQSGSATSQAAAESVAHIMGAQEWAVLDFVAGRGDAGAIRDDCERAVKGLKTPAACARLNALELSGLVELRGDKRPGLSGRSQQVYHATAAGLRRLAGRKT